MNKKHKPADREPTHEREARAIRASLAKLFVSEETKRLAEIKRRLEAP
jgi:hypothetical protein